MKPAALLTTNVVGGLGNQLFLIANLLATSRRTGIPAFVDPVPYSSSAEAPRPTYWSSLFRNLSQHGVYTTTTSGPAACASALPWVPVPETRPVRKVTLDAQRPCVYNMVGFFQCADFFSDHPVLQSVVPAEAWEAAHVHLQRHYQSDLCHTVALHIRRGDYTRFRDIFEQLEVDYYDAAVRQLLGGWLLLLPRAAPSASSLSASSASPAPHLLIFCDELRVAQTVAGYFRTRYSGVRVSVVSEDLEAAEEDAAHRPGSGDATFSSAHVLRAGCGPSSDTSSSSISLPREVLEMLMMAQCNDVVMANSTFSWWGAYLNSVPLRRVIAPSRWFVKDPYPASNHLYCPGWTLI